MTDDLKKGSIPLRERRAIADEWKQFAETIMPANAPEVQRVETKRAWYAGAAAMFGLLTFGWDADAEPTKLDLAYAESIHHELEQFAARLGAGLE